MRMKRLIENLRLVVLISREVYRASVKERMMYGFLLLALLFILMANVPFMTNDSRIFEGQPPVMSAIGTRPTYVMRYRTNASRTNSGRSVRRCTTQAPHTNGPMNPTMKSIA